MAETTKKEKIMTPKEKAEELCYLYQGDFEKGTLNMNWTMAKKCALIAFNEIVKCVNHKKQRFTNDNYSEDYWQEVKQEIEKL